MEERKKLNPAIIAIIVIVLVGIVATSVILLNKKDTTSTAETSSQSTTTTTPTTSDSNVTYKDGSYTQTGDYISPGGKQSITVTVTIADNVITDTTLVQNATDSESREHQAEFASGYKALVVGKKVNTVSLSRVAGSSLTSTGFNTALTKIKADAQA